MEAHRYPVEIGTLIFTLARVGRTNKKGTVIILGFLIVTYCSACKQVVKSFTPGVVIELLDGLREISFNSGLVTIYLALRESMWNIDTTV